MRVEKVLMTIALLLLAATALSAQETVLRVDDRLGPDDEMREGAAIDWYRFSVEEAGRIRVHAVSVDFEPRLIVRASDAGEAFSEGSRGSVTLSTYVRAGGDVEVGVTAVLPQDADGGAAGDGESGDASSPGEGRYSIRVLRQNAPEALRVGETRRGVLEREDEQLADQRYIDWYPLEIDGERRVFISASSREIDTYLFLQQPDGSSIENDDYSDSNAGLSYTTEGPTVLQVGVSTYSAESTGQYDLSIAELPLPRKIEIGQTVIGRLDAEDAPLGNTDAYSLRGEPGDLAVLRLSSNDFDTVLELRLPDGSVRENDDGPGDTTNSQLFHAFEGEGPVELVVRSFGGDGQGKYELSILNFVTEQGIESVSDGQLLQDGESVSAILDQESPERDSRPFQRFTFNAEEGRRIRVTMESRFFDTFLTVVSPDGRRFEDDDGAGGTDSLVDVQAPETGTYELIATSFSPSGVGPYTLRFEEGDRVERIEELEASLTDATAERNENGRLVAEHRFSGTADQEVTIEVSSNEFDTRLVLVDPDGRVVAENDDYGSGTDSRIVRRLGESGTYTVRVSGYWQDSEGRYSLVISE